ncbi:MAG: hypothetical protein ACOCYE_01080 [Pseudomonadota bacterium]
MRLDEIRRAIGGAIDLLKDDPRGMDAFDLSLPGFVRSFVAVLLVLPVYALVLVVQDRQLGPGVDATPVTVRLVGYLLQWAAFVCTAVVLAKVLRREAYFVAYVIAANWASVVQIVIVLVVVLLTTLVPPVLTGLALVLMVVGLLVYDYRVVRIAFAAPGFDGMAVVAIQFMVTLLVQRLVAT